MEREPELRSDVVQQCINRRPIVIVFFVAVQYTYSIESSPPPTGPHCDHVFRFVQKVSSRYWVFCNTSLDWSLLPKTLTELRAFFVCKSGD